MVGVRRCRSQRSRKVVVVKPSLARIAGARWFTTLLLYYTTTLLFYYSTTLLTPHHRSAVVGARRLARHAAKYEARDEAFGVSDLTKLERLLLEVFE